MITTNKKYTIFKPKKFVTNEGKTIWSFSVGDSKFNKDDKKWETQGFVNISTFNNNMELQDRDKIEFSEITGIQAQKYLDKTGKEIEKTVIWVKLNDSKENDDIGVSSEIFDNEPLPF